MDRFLKILQNEFPEISIEDIYSPIKQTNIDSLDLVLIRVLLEKYYNFIIPDIKWFNFSSLSEVYQFYQSNLQDKNNADLESIPELSIDDTIEIRMPQMINKALSEKWLFEYLGDIHWQLLSKGFDVQSSMFKNENGHRLYATFIRICIETSPLNYFNENDIINFKSTVKGFGNDTYLSNVIATSNRNIIKSNLMTVFSIRKDEKTNDILKSAPNSKTDTIGQFIHTPLFLNDYRLLRKGLIDTLLSNEIAFDVSTDILYTCEYQINPFCDINGVGLLYFAVYPIISDNCLLKYKPNAIDFNTVFRDVFYFSNCNINDIIIFELNSFTASKNEIKLVSTLIRKSDNIVLAKIFTIKRKDEKERL